MSNWHKHRRYALLFLLLIPLLAISSGVSAQDNVSVIFLHHSCGHNLIEEGGVREGMTARGYDFYDHGYNGDGLRLADGTYTGDNYNVPDDNTDPDGIARIFSQPLHSPPDNTFSYLMQYDVIAFKSCFPTSNIYDDSLLEEYQSYYLTVRDRVDQYPDKLFVVVTQPPQVPNSSDPQEARRARALADWLSSDEYLGGRENLVTFDFFGYLAGSDNFLRPEYRVDEWDAHPNGVANATIGPIFVDFLDANISAFMAGGPRPTTTVPGLSDEAEEPVDEAAESESQPGSGGAAAAGGLIEGFEAMGEWWPSTDDASVVECNADSNFAHEGSASLRFHYTVSAGGWADCGTNFETPQDWSSSDGISLWMLSDTPGQSITWMVFAGEPDQEQPYEAFLQTSEESVNGWVQVSFAWDEFTIAEWAEDTSVPFDTTRVIGYGFSVVPEDALEGITWIDEIALMGGGDFADEPVDESAEEAAGEVEAEAVVDEPEQPQPDSGDEVDQPDSGETGGGGLCGSAAILPVLAAGAIFFNRKRMT
ncbi:MAG: CIA30 family protein [Anaerolineae bacterium]|nr:CIA30 family protein [Anaerolineae bacterium]